MNLIGPYGNLFGIVFATIWVGVTGALYSRAHRLGMDYYARFPDEIQFVEGSLNMPSSFSSNKAMWRVMLQEQPDPALERMRREIWRRLRLFAAWLFAFPISVFTVIGILTSAGYIR